MDGNRWRQIKTLLQEAMDKPADARETFLRQTCGPDQSMLGEVLTLLRADNGDVTLLDHQVKPYEAVAHPIPEKIGFYKVLRELGRGGMGTVYLAVRDDGAFEKQVALKVLHPGLDTERFIRSFDRERQILADLNHPNIAGLYDGGTTPDGRPFLVMEYVNGEPIHHYCNRRQLSLRDRLHLFRKVCAAVHFAHRNLVVHRDIKPGNILVTADGQPKLLDFGIAKILRRDPAVTGQTVTTFHMMTPEYASPEQIKSEAITTASDIYALGVLGYELLTGQRPHGRHCRNPAEIRRAICEEAPIRPSQAAVAPHEGKEGHPPPVKLKENLSGDLDHILLMALRKEPERRYASAQQLSEDILRFLKGFPVLAGKDTLAYVLGKFVRRHRLAVAATVLGFLTALALVAGMWSQHQKTLVATDRAERERSAKEWLAEILMGILAEADPLFFDMRGKKPPLVAEGKITVREVLDRAKEKIDREFQMEPTVRADLLSAMGTGYLNIGLPEQARPLWEESLAIRLRVLGDFHPDTAHAYFGLGRVAYEKGEFSKAEQALKRAQAILDEFPGVPLRKRVEVQNVLAMVYYYQDRHEEARQCYRKVLPLLDNSPESKVLAGRINGNLGTIFYREGQYLKAIEAHSQAVASIEAVLGDQHPHLADVLDFLGIDYRKKGRLEEAEALFQRAFDIRNQKLSPNNRSIALSLDNLGLVYYQRKQYDQAEHYFSQSLPIKENALGLLHYEVAETHNLLAIVYRRRGELEKSETHHYQALSIREQLLGPKNINTAITHHNLSNVYLDLGYLDEAEYHHGQAHRIFEAKLGPQHPDYALTLHVRSRLLENRGQLSEAYRTALQGFEILQREYPDPDHPVMVEMCELINALEQKAGGDLISMSP